MNQTLYSQLEFSISKDRLDEYARTLNTTKSKTIFTYYMLNSELSKSLYVPLKNLEVALRNNIHNALSSFYNNELWYETDGLLLANEIKKINEVKQKLKSSNKQITSSDIVAGLSFGFWTALFSKPYEQKIWIKHIKDIFPNIPKNMKNRNNLSSKINTIRYFRNRVFHFEPIFNKSNLKSVYVDVLNMIKWLNMALYDITVEFDEFEKVCKNETKNTVKKLNNVSKRYDKNHTEL